MQVGSPWIDVAASTSATVGDILAYSAQIDAQDVLTLYSEEDGSGGIDTLRVVVGTSSSAQLGSSNIPTGGGGSLLVTNGILCVDNGSEDCDASSRALGGVFARSGSLAGLDLAENYPTKDPDLSAGELAMLDPDNEVFVTTYDRSASSTREDSFIGVISTAPGVFAWRFWN